MREPFIKKKLNAAALQIIDLCNAILRAYEADGFDLSLRQLYYQLVSKNVIPNNEREYKKLGDIVSDARLLGLMDWGMIKDRGRVTHSNSHWETPAEILRTAARTFRLDLWKNQPVHLEVMVEKQALEGVLLPVCMDEDVHFCANKGYSSQSALYETGLRLREIRRGYPIGRTERAEIDNRLKDYRHIAKAADEGEVWGKRIVVLYLGDHDPSGIDMTRDVRDRLELFSAGTVEVIRVALNMDQIDELQPPENPAKVTDSRAADYIARFGESSWELDAIEARALADLVREAIIKERDPELWDEACGRQEMMREELGLMADKYDAEHPTEDEQ